jgi:ComF family protein
MQFKIPQLSFLKKVPLHIVKNGLEFLLPSRCLSCGVRVEQQGLVCGECWKNLTFITSPKCPSCSLPYPFEVEKDMLCGPCAAKEYDFDQALSVLHYNDTSRQIVLAFKHSDKTFMAPYLAKLLYQAGAPFMGKTDLVVPVPLHKTKLRLRRYNQAALLADALSKIAKIPTQLNLLKRVHKTGIQGGKKRGERFSNVKNVFEVDPKDQSLLKRKNILLIDDVLTTGATLSSCARTLKKAGAANVFALTLCRVIK